MDTSAVLIGRALYLEHTATGHAAEIEKSVHPPSPKGGPAPLQHRLH